jgi:hypothetical protein
MPKPRSRVIPRHIDVHCVDTSVDFPALPSLLEAKLTAQPDLGFFLNATKDLIRVGGLDMYGDILIRPASEKHPRKLIVAFRQGDRAKLDALLASSSEIWLGAPRPAAPTTTPGTALLNFLQHDLIIECVDRVRISDRALEDAFCCRDFLGLSDLRLKLVELHGQARKPESIESILWADYSPKELRAAARANTPHTILHDGMKYVLYLNESLKQRRGSSLTLRLALCPKHRAYVIGTLIEYSDA